MAHWPLNARPTKAHRISRSSSTVTQVTLTGGASHVKGAWVEVEASTAGRVRQMILLPSDSFASATATNMLLDIGTGGAGSESVIISNLLIGYADVLATVRGPLYLPIPIAVPSATRIAARIQGLIASDTLKLGMDLWGGVPWEGLPSVAVVDTYGVDTATSKGTVITASATPNSKGSWVDITTSTARSHKSLMLLAQPNNRIVTANENWICDIGLWNGSSYDVIWPDQHVRYNSTEIISYHTGPPLAVLGFSIPRGARLGVRGACSTASLTLDVALYGMG